MQKNCIVIPCYNEARRLDIASIVDFIENNKTIFDILLVNDGSTDNTLILLNKLQEQFTENVVIINLFQNQGKAEAVRSGMLHCSGLNYTYVGYWDADLSTPLNESIRFISHFNGSTKLIMGSRLKRLGATIERSTKRHIFGRIFSTFTSLILDLPVYDSQCGAKIFDAEIIKDLFGQEFKTKWLFDVELLARYKLLVDKKKLLENVVEIPLVEWREVKGSKLNLFTLLMVPFELLKIKSYYKL